MRELDLETKCEDAPCESSIWRRNASTFHARARFRVPVRTLTRELHFEAKCETLHASATLKNKSPPHKKKMPSVGFGRISSCCMSSAAIVEIRTDALLCGMAPALMMTPGRTVACNSHTELITVVTGMLQVYEKGTRLLAEECQTQIVQGYSNTPIVNTRPSIITPAASTTTNAGTNLLEPNPHQLQHCCNNISSPLLATPPGFIKSFPQEHQGMLQAHGGALRCTKPHMYAVSAVGFRCLQGNLSIGRHWSSDVAWAFCRCMS